jgi:hypothetical protein
MFCGVECVLFVHGTTPLDLSAFPKSQVAAAPPPAYISSQKLRESPDVTLMTSMTCLSPAATISSVTQPVQTDISGDGAMIVEPQFDSKL